MTPYPSKLRDEFTSVVDSQTIALATTKYIVANEGRTIHTAPTVPNAPTASPRTLPDSEALHGGVQQRPITINPAPTIPAFDDLEQCDHADPTDVMRVTTREMALGGSTQSGPQVLHARWDAMLSDGLEGRMLYWRDMFNDRT